MLSASKNDFRQCSDQKRMVNKVFSMWFELGRRAIITTFLHLLLFFPFGHNRPVEVHVYLNKYSYWVHFNRFEREMEKNESFCWFLLHRILKDFRTRGKPLELVFHSGWSLFSARVPSKKEAIFRLTVKNSLDWNLRWKERLFLMKMLLTNSNLIGQFQQFCSL